MVFDPHAPRNGWATRRDRRQVGVNHKVIVPPVSSHAGFPSGTCRSPILVVCGNRSRVVSRTARRVPRPGRDCNRTRFDRLWRIWSAALADTCSALGLDLEIAYHSDCTYTSRCYEAEVYAVLLNLLTNSFKAVREGADRRVRIEARIDDGGIHVCRVYDTGVGIPS